jgi:hypothetical protein
MLGMLGIDDTWVALGFLLSLCSAVLCVVYGLLTRNKGDEPVQSDDVAWAEHEKQVEEEL